MNTGFLWHNESDPNVEAIGRYVDDQHDACDGMGIVRAGDEWELCHCTMAALMAAQPETPSLRLVQNAPATARWSNRNYADAASAAGGNSTQTAGDGSTQTAGWNSVQVCFWWDDGKWNPACRIVPENHVNQWCKVEKGIWRLCTEAEREEAERKAA